MSSALHWHIKGSIIVAASKINKMAIYKPKCRLLVPGGPLKIQAPCPFYLSIFFYNQLLTLSQLFSWDLSLSQ